MKNIDDFKDIIEQIENSAGHKIDSSARLLEISFKLVVINNFHLEQWISTVPYFAHNQKEESSKYQIESLRHFVNYINSAIAFRDHTRKYVSDIYGSTDTAINGEYKKKIDSDFANDALTQFVEEIRNVYNHQKILPIGIQTKVKDGEFYSRVVIFTKELKSNYNLGSKSILFLNELANGDNIDVMQVSKDYLLKSIFPWLMTQQAFIHRQEFQELDALKKKARIILGDK